MTAVLTIDRVTKTYKTGSFGGKEFAAVRDVSFDVIPGEVVSLIGESGSGKTTIGKMVLRLAAISKGRMTFEGKDVSHVRGAAVKEYYRRVQGVFQDPFSSFNPIFKADRVLGMVHEEYFPHVPGSEWDAKVEDSLEAVGLNAGQVLHKYPHQLSGGQLQRMLIARALLLDIRLLIADEIISMLDASTRIDVLNLLGDLRARGLGILFITHDLSLGNYISAKTVILRRGRVVEMGETAKVFGNPLHPYTRALIASVPQLHRKWGDVEQAMGVSHLHFDVEGRLLAERGDAAATTCLYHDAYPATAGATQGTEVPAMARVEDGHFVGCFELEGEAA